MSPPNTSLTTKMQSVNPSTDFNQNFMNSTINVRSGSIQKTAISLHKPGLKFAGQIVEHYQEQAEPISR